MPPSVISVQVAKWISYATTMLHGFWLIFCTFLHPATTPFSATPSGLNALLLRPVIEWYVHLTSLDWWCFHQSGWLASEVVLCMVPHELLSLDIADLALH